MKPKKSIYEIGQHASQSFVSSDWLPVASDAFADFRSNVVPKLMHGAGVILRTVFYHYWNANIVCGQDQTIVRKHSVDGDVHEFIQTIQSLYRDLEDAVVMTVDDEEK
jgi:hypothetical protein